MQQNKEFKRLEDTFSFLAKLRSIFANKKNTVVLLGFQQFTGKIAKNIGMWMLGAKVLIKKKQCQMVSSDGINSKQIGLTDNFSIHIHQNDKNRVITVDFFNANLEKNEDCLANFVLALTFVQKNREKSLVKICGLLKSQSDNYKKLKQQQRQLFPKICIVQWDPEEQSEGSLNIVKNNGEASQGPKSLDFLFVDQVNHNLQNFIKQKIQNTGFKRSLQGLRSNLTKYILLIIKPLVNLFGQVYKSSDTQSYILKNLYKNEIENIRKIIEGHQQLKKQIEQMKKRWTKKNKIDDDIAWKYYAMNIITWRQTSEQKAKKKEDRQLNIFRSFFKQILEGLKTLPLQMEETDLVYLSAMVNMIEEQFQLLELISQRNFGLAIQDIFSGLNLKVNKSEVKPIQIQQKIAQNAVKIKMKQNQNLDYYESIKLLLQNSVSRLDLSKLANKDQINKNMQEIHLKLPTMRTISIIQSEYSQPRQLVQTIKYFFSIHFGENPMKFDSNSLFKIFKGIGKKLTNMGYFQLALQIYKKIKFQIQIQRCVNHIILKNGFSNLKQASQLYIQTAYYFLEAGNTAKALRFAQLAYQNSPDISYIAEIINMKKLVHSKFVDQQEEKLVQNLASQRKDFNAYFSYNLTDNFKQSIQNLEQPRDDINLDIVVTQEQLSKFSFFSQALTQDD